MAFNGSGTFVRLYNWVNDKAANIKVRADRMDAEMDGMATGLSTCITKDGQTTITANLPMANFRHTGVGNASARTDYAAAGQVQDGKLNWVAAGGTADAITATYSPAITTLVDGQICYVRAGSANATTTPTFAPNGLPARTITKNGNQALVAGDIYGSGHEIILRYRLSDTKWELLNPVYPFVPSLAPFVDSTAIIKGSADATKLLRIEVDGFTTATTRVLTPPNYDGTIATLAGIEALSNKTISSSTFVDSTTTFVDNSDATKQLAFQCSGITTGTTRTVTIPDKSGTLAMTSDAQMVLLSAQTVSNAATLSFTGFMSSTYRIYKIYLYDVYGASAAALWCRYGIAASYISTSTYNSSIVGRDSAGNPENADNAGGDKIIMSGASLQATSTQGGVWEITIYHPSHSNETRMTWSGSYKSDSLSRYNSHMGSGMNTGTSAITDVQFLMASGNIYATGLMYGIV